MRLLICILLLVCFTRIKSKNPSEPVDLTYYNLLEITASATQQEIRQAFKKLAVKLHPDKNPDADVSAQFVKISEAYETLKDPDKRRQYDLHGPDANNDDQYGQSNYNNLFHKGLYADDPHVQNLVYKNYYDSGDGFHFVNLYSPFCPPCQKLSNVWKKLAETYRDIVKIAVVNCEHQSSFCYNEMRITSYPTLLFYADGMNGEYTRYRGDRSYEALNEFLMSRITDKARLKYDKLIKSKEKLTVYIMGDSWLKKEDVFKLAYKLKDFAKVVQIMDEQLRRQLSKDEYTTVVVDVLGEIHHISDTTEQDILQHITTLLPVLPAITTDKLKDIRNHLRNYVGQNPWMIHFHKENSDNLFSQRLKNKFSDIEFGAINCDEEPDLCVSLQVEETPAWAIIKPGGAYERFHGTADFQSLSNFIKTAKDTENVQTLSLSELTRIMEGDAGFWITAVVPHKVSWSELTNTFIAASRAFKHVQFGIMMCQANMKKHCDPIAENRPVVVVQNGTQRYFYHEKLQQRYSLTQFIDILMDNSATKITEDEFSKLMAIRINKVDWVIAFFPEKCSEKCAETMYEFKVVAKKLSAVENLNVAIHYCHSQSRLCAQSNVDSPLVRVYPAHVSRNFVGHMDTMGSAAYISEWVLSVIDNYIQQLSHSAFVTNVRKMQESSLTEGSNKPWLIYFHSPKCYHCYEMFADFYVVARILKDAVKLGKINCIKEELTCNQENIRRYPSIKLYKTEKSRLRSFDFDPKNYEQLLKDITPFVEVETDNVDRLAKLSITERTIDFHDEF